MIHLADEGVVTLLEVCGDYTMHYSFNEGVPLFHTRGTQDFVWDHTLQIRAACDFMGAVDRMQVTL